MASAPLFSADKCALVVIDVQDYFLAGRSERVPVGLETDVCICHSALGLLDQGFRVAAIKDATASPPPHHDAGLRRMAAAGVILTNTKGIYYEWVRDLATHARVKSRINLPMPAGLTL